MEKRNGLVKNKIRAMSLPTTIKSILGFGWCRTWSTGCCGSIRLCLYFGQWRGYAAAKTKHLDKSQNQFFHKRKFSLSQFTHVILQRPDRTVIVAQKSTPCIPVENLQMKFRFLNKCRWKNNL